jgi:polyribonucleotide nucleotidyltransferase
MKFPLDGGYDLVTMSERVVAQIGDQSIIIESGKLAKQADGAVTVQLGETIVVVAAVAATKAKPGQEFFPLTVDYRERAAAAGRFPGGYFKREGRPSEKEILTSRIIDRPIRPLFPKGWFNEVQVQAILLSADGQNDADILAANGASAALTRLRHPLGRPHRRRPRRPRRRPVRRQPHPRPIGGQRSRPHLRRQ